MYITGIGTIVNIAAVAAGCTVGLFCKKIISENLNSALMGALSLSTIAVGLVGTVTNGAEIASSALSSRYSLIMIISLVLGTAIGTAVNIERRLDSFGEFCQKKLSGGSSSSTFAQGFVSSSLVFCVGSMAVMGSLSDGIAHDPTILFAKSALDGIISIVFASTLGAGVYLSMLSLLVYQGAITLAAALVAPYLTDEVVAQMSLIGSILIMGIGLNFVYKPKFKVGNMLPAVFIPIVYYIFRSLLNF